MVRAGVERVPVRQLDDLAQVHDGNAVAHLPDNGEVVGNEQVGQAEAGLQVGQQRQDLGLDGHVEGGHRLVEHHEAGLDGQ